MKNFVWRGLRPIFRFPYSIVTILIRTIKMKRVNTSGKYSNEIKKICELGFSQFNHHLTSEDLTEIKKIDDVIKEKVQVNGAPGFQRFHNIHNEHALPKGFFNKCNELAKEYFNTSSSTFEATQYQISWHHPQNNPPGLGYHVDDYGKILKFFIFFNEVTDKNGPFKILESSRNFMKMIHGFMWIWLTNLKRTYYEIDHIPSSLLKNERKFLCSPMSIYAVDTSSLHSASQVIEGERRILVLTFRDTRFEI